MKLSSPALCTGCMACVDSCHHEALAITIDHNGFYHIDTNDKNCVNCGLCSKVCPVLNPSSIDKDNIALSEPYAAWCEDNELRSKSASGGAFAAIAKAFLEKGAVVYGATIDGFDICHKRIETIEELPQLLGSKYQHSRMDGIYSLVKKDLKEGKTVLFSGLSCQVAGVIRYVGEKLLDKLFSIDTICGGLSTMLPMMKIKESANYKGVLSFRDKENGWKSKGFKYALKLIRIDGTIENLGMDNMMLQCFCHKETKRSSCYDCLFNGFHRESDVTIGDFWGDTRFTEQHTNGVSVVVLHNDRVKSIIDASSLHLESVLWKDVVEANPSLYWSHYPNYRKSYTRKRVFTKLRAGDEEAAMIIMDNSSIMRRIENRILLSSNEKEREEYLRNVLENNTK